MEKVKRFFRELNEKRAYQVVFFVVSMCVVLGMYANIHNKIVEAKAHTYEVIVDNQVIKNIDKVTVNGNVLEVSGWCFNKNIDSTMTNVQVFLKNMSDGNDVIWMNVKDAIREDIDNYFECEYDYSHSGFVAKKRIRKSDIENNNYEIFVKLTYIDKIDSADGSKEKIVEKTVSTKRYIKNGSLTAINPKDNIELVKTKSIELNRIMEKGVLLTYRQDVDMYIYQYEGKLYWIAGKEYCFEEDGSTTIQFQLDTTRVDKLPRNRIENEWFWDNNFFVFEENELKNENYYPYRVAFSDIPSQYPITFFWTGYHVNSEWVWIEYLNLEVNRFVN